MEEFKKKSKKLYTVHIFDNLSISLLADIFIVAQKEGPRPPLKALKSF